MNRKEVDFYEKLASENRGTTRQVGWGSEYTQKLRFKVLCDVASSLLTPDQKISARVVDLGCGRGDLVPVLRAEGFLGEYVGIDGVEANIADANALYANASTSFRLMNWNGVSPLDVEGGVDLFFVSGAFGATEPNTRNRFLLRMLNEHAKIGVVSNFLRKTDRVDHYDSEAVLTSPDDIVSILDPAVFRFILRADYLWNDFTIGIVRWN